MNHAFDNLEDCTGNGTYWRMQNARVQTLGYDGPVYMETQGGRPGERHMAAVISWLHMGQDRVDWIASEMMRVFNEYICMHYGLPLISHPSDIWQHISGINALHVEENGDVDFEFIFKHDADHDFAVRIKGGAFYEVMLDG